MPSNMAKPKKVSISLANGSDKLVLKIQNTGKPFPDLKGESMGMGLRITSYRARTLEIKPSGARGTVVTCSVPVNGSKEQSNPRPAERQPVTK